MSDNLTFNLAAGGYNVAKYMVYGPVTDVLPYLVGRAQENTSVTGEMGRELRLLGRAGPPQSGALTAHGEAGPWIEVVAQELDPPALEESTPPRIVPIRPASRSAWAQSGQRGDRELGAGAT